MRLNKSNLKFALLVVSLLVERCRSGLISFEVPHAPTTLNRKNFLLSYLSHVIENISIYTNNIVEMLDFHLLEKSISTVPARLLNGYVVIVK
jgi:hypothetical protein